MKLVAGPKTVESAGQGYSTPGAKETAAEAIWNLAMNEDNQVTLKTFGAGPIVHAMEPSRRSGSQTVE